MSVIITVLAACILAIVIALLAYSPGEPEQFVDESGSTLPGSISEKVFVKIGGVDQGMFIRSKGLNKPVLLFVHGGPCFSEYFLIDKYSPGLEDYFTVCYWEERGGGLSYNKDVTLESITMDQLTSDTLEVTNYLRERFGQEKIYLMAHSGGTAFAIRAAEKSPELYSAYIGIAQITRMAESEKLAYEYLIDQYTATGNEKMIEKLKEYPVLESDTHIIPFFKSVVRDQAMHEMGVGTMRGMDSLVKDIVLPVMTCKAYTLKEKMNIWISKFTFIRKSRIIDELFAADLTQEIQKLEIPVYFFSGAYDLTVNHELSKEYLMQMEAPAKGFYTFESSAHSPIFEEPERMQEILRQDVLTGKSSHADALMP